ncbi:MAG TPA: AMP-binding protein [Acidimicrobiia bacterium]|nr:AMP-binding protein [Acidimicrobiia bacterium]
MTERTWINVTTLGDLVDQRAAAHPDREAVVFPNARSTYADLAARTDQVAKSLLALGVGPGDRVGYFLHESIDTATTLLGIAKTGAIAAPINSRFKPFELKQVITHCGMKVIVTASPGQGTDFAGLILETFPEITRSEGTRVRLDEAPELEAVVVLEDESPAGTFDRAAWEALADGVTDEALRHRQSAVRVRDTAVIMYTSGTTAMPKGAMLSHEAFLRFSSSTVDDRKAITDGNRVWTALPLFHIGGVAFITTTLYAGGTFVHTGFFDPKVAAAQIRDEPCEVALPGFETIWMPVLGAADEGDLDALRVLLLVGVEERLRQAAAATPQATLIGCFGQTEACAFLSLSELDDPLERRILTDGLPMPGMECEVHDPETGERLDAPAEGELWYRGPQAFDGYFRDPELTASVFDERGFFRTGDVVRMFEDGSILFVSRVKDMLKVGGENVSAAEVEGYLLTHPAVAMAQVVAAPDARYVEVPAAFVMLKPDTEATEQEIIDYCRGQIATYRIPRYVRFVSEYPMSGTKVKKYVLREMMAKELADKGITEAPKILSD